jgi:hypothetical protein
MAVLTAAVFLTATPVFAERRTGVSDGCETSGTRFYGESEVTALIDELTEAAEREIETAAGEAAKAAALAGLEKQAAQLAEIERLNKQNGELKKNVFKKIIVAGLAGFASGALLGGGLVLFAGR